MRIVIFGSTGFLGRNLLEYFERGGHRVLGAKRGDPISISLSLPLGIPDLVISTVGEIYDESTMVSTNIGFTKELLDCCRVFGVDKVILLGSSSEYGYKTQPMKETDILEPRTLYEATKGAATLMAQAYAQTHGMNITVIRPFSVFGRYDKPHKLFPTIYRAYKQNLPIQISPGVHDYIYIDDFCQAVDWIAICKAAPRFDIVNVGYGCQWTNRSIVQKFEFVTNYHYKIQPIPRLRDYDSLSWVADTTKLTHNYNFKRQYSLQEGMEAFIEDCERLKLYE
jgi:nucleoside-diphosphate-sugar epimerase